MHAVVFLSMQLCKGLGNHSHAHTGGVRGAVVLHLLPPFPKYKVYFIRTYLDVF